ncbi:MULTISPECIES: hypothetical protein [Bacillales]|uniref:hypothetical protein n=1 Tax=Bacillales TaxID=1385 RepID=UPI00096D5B4B|nr:MULTISPECIES: hypothetical protein [Bacillales]MBN8199834.1 hypothetical protein [Bacillus sp. NTK034]MCM3705617.1 hypothetical protein [Cytobacillus firmus]OMF63396.1 hypothetical protein BK139_01665 [Paenibacillus sp. FSL R5-0490]
MPLNRETLISKLLSLSKFQHNHSLFNLSDRKLEALYLDHILFSPHPHSGHQSIKLIGKNR